MFKALQNISAAGLKRSFIQLMTLRTTKSGKFVGEDQYGNRYFEDETEATHYRDRWVEPKWIDFEATQIPPEWHMWMSRISDRPGSKVPKAPQVFAAPHTVNLTGTPAAFKTYSTTKSAIETWEAVPRERR